MREPLVELAGYVKEVGDLETCCRRAPNVSKRLGVARYIAGEEDSRVADNQRILTSPSTSLHSSAMDLYPCTLSSGFSIANFLMYRRLM